jgi:hypothetical protein
MTNFVTRQTQTHKTWQKLFGSDTAGKPAASFRVKISPESYYIDFSEVTDLSMRFKLISL